MPNDEMWEADAGGLGFKSHQLGFIIIGGALGNPIEVLKQGHARVTVQTFGKPDHCPH
jgi:hypothetical protein